MRFQYSDRITEEVALSGMNHTNQRYRWDADRGDHKRSYQRWGRLEPGPKARSEEGGRIAEDSI